MLTKNEKIGFETKNSENNKKNCSTATTSTISCCNPPAKTLNQLPIKTETSESGEKIPKDLLSALSKKTSSCKTCITVNYDAGYPNQLFIRGNGANLCWDKGQPLKNIKADQWIWETCEACINSEFKILINDQIYENGDNHLITSQILSITPNFS